MRPSVPSALLLGLALAGACPAPAAAGAPPAEGAAPAPSRAPSNPADKKPKTAAPPAARPPAGAPARPAAPPTRNIGGPGDFGLRERLIQHLAHDPELGRAAINVVLANGGAVFSGTIDTWAQRRRALSLAGAERGIINVTDQMETPRGSVTDADLGRAVATRLQDDNERLGLEDLKVQVEEGIATLDGTVKDFAARVRAEETSGTLLGLVRIVNRLRPRSAPSGTDDVTTRKAVVAFLSDFREYPYPAEIEVQVKDGRATLGGRVGLYLGRQQAGTMALLVGGVREVDNRIQVDPSLQMTPTTVTGKP